MKPTYINTPTYLIAEDESYIKITFNLDKQLIGVSARMNTQQDIDVATIMLKTAMTLLPSKDCLKVHSDPQEHSHSELEPPATPSPQGSGK